MNEFSHTSVLLWEVIRELNIKPGGVYVDGTLGGAGHSLEIIKKAGPEGTLIGFDQDRDAIIASMKRLEDYQKQVIICRNNYETMPEKVPELGFQTVDGILLDLGVSSYQLDTAERGFSYMQDAPLDMRMDQRNDLTAGDIVNTYSKEELVRILRVYGEEKFATNIAANILKHREGKPIETTFELNAIIDESIPMKQKRTGGHPAKRTYQALRIECNRELSVLEDNLEGMIDLLGEGGRLCVITFHSLEDRIVKNIFRTAEDPCICPKEFPVCVCGRKSKGKVITRKPILPGQEEMAANSRSKSAKLRVFERHLATE